MQNITPAQYRVVARINAKIAQADFALPGSIAYQSTSCGNQNCRCTANPPVLHGPYPTSTRKVAGNIVIRRLSETQHENYKTWFEAAKRYRELLSELEALSLSIIESELRPLANDSKQRDISNRKTLSLERLPN